MTTSNRTQLTHKQALFVEAYIANGGNATQAAQTAEYTGNDVTLAAVGYENLNKPQIKQAIELRKQELADSGHLPDADQILRELWGIARNPNADYSPRVSALRTLADTKGMLGGGKTDLPPGSLELMEALGRGLGESARALPPVQDASFRAIEAPEAPGDQQQDAQR